MDDKKAGRWLLAGVFAFSALVSCSDNGVTGPTLVPGGLRVQNQYLLQTQDDCYYGFYSLCHADEVTFESVDQYWDCPVGCHTYPVDAVLRNKITAALSRIDTSLCPWAKNYINYYLFHNMIRYFDQNYSEYGDFHLSQMGATTPDSSGALHIYKPVVDNQIELAKTLVHEAYHGYFNSMDDIAAEGNAQACVH